MRLRGAVDHRERSAEVTAEHALKVGDAVRPDPDWVPAFARMPAVVLRFKPSTLPGKRDALVEWATGERAWAPEWACHAPAWDRDTGRGCPCGQVAAIVGRTTGRDYV